MLLVGLTGGIASGKSTVGRMLARAGIPVVDADVLARESVAPGSDGLDAVVARFGPLLLPDGTLDRKALGAVVFADAAARADLNAIVHPRVAQLAAERLDALREAGHAEAVYEVPLLFESGLDAMVDKTLLVAVPLDVQRARLMARDGIDAAAADARIQSQLPLAEKRARRRGGGQRRHARRDRPPARACVARDRRAVDRVHAVRRARAGARSPQRAGAAAGAAL